MTRYSNLGAKPVIAFSSFLFGIALTAGIFKATGGPSQLHEVVLSELQDDKWAKLFAGRWHIDRGDIGGPTESIGTFDLSGIYVEELTEGKDANLWAAYPDEWHNHPMTWFFNDGILFLIDRAPSERVLIHPFVPSFEEDRNVMTLTSPHTPIVLRMTRLTNVSNAAR
ncbi:MAG: hypothetical protein AAGC97_10560 [Planctomycetota bacterium]